MRLEYEPPGCRSGSAGTRCQPPDEHGRGGDRLPRMFEDRIEKVIAKSGSAGTSSSSSTRRTPWSAGSAMGSPPTRRTSSSRPRAGESDDRATTATEYKRSCRRTRRSPGGSGCEDRGADPRGDARDPHGLKPRSRRTTGGGPGRGDRLRPLMSTGTPFPAAARQVINWLDTACVRVEIRGTRERPSRRKTCST